MDAVELKWIERLGNSPGDLETRLEYAAWLAKRNRNARSKLLRLDVERTKLRNKGKVWDGPGLTKKEEARLRKIEGEIYDQSRTIDARWIVKVDPALAIPPGLPVLGLKAAQVIVDFLGNQRWMYQGGRSAFEAPEPSTSKFSKNAGPAVLVVCHAEGQLDECVGFVSGSEDLHQRLMVELEKIGVWSEAYDESISVIYPSEYAGFAIGLG